MSNYPMIGAIFLLSLLGGLFFFFVHRSMRLKAVKSVWDQKELWFTADPRPVFLKGDGPTAKWYLPLEVEGNAIDLPLPSDYDYLKKIFPKGVDWNGYLFTIPIRCCVVGKDIVGIQYGDLPPSDPKYEIELPSGLTSQNNNLKNQISRANIFLILAIAALVPGACVILQVIASFLRL